MSRKEKNSSAAGFGNTGILAGSIIIAAIIILVGILFATGNLGGSATADGITAVPPMECGGAVISYFNTNLAPANSNATLIRVIERYGVYQIAVNYQERNTSFYATKDCNLMFTGIYSLKETPAPTTSPKATTAPTPVPLPVKSARPSVELFVMSFCPFGVQAEAAMGPVVDLLGTKADFNIRYIATVNGDTVDQVKSLHGLPEAKEDLRQLCVDEYYPEKVWPYLMDLNALCYPLTKNATQLASCQQNVTATLGMDNQKIETCATGSEGLALLEADEGVTTSLKVTGSPTIFMNGQKYAGQRTAEAYKQAICERFETPPSACAVNLSAPAPAS